MTMAHSITTLYAEELKATMRGRFTWLGAAVILLAVGGLATVGTQDTWLYGYGIIAYGLVPLGFVPVAAGMIASPRVNRFVECVFTAPVNRRDWLAAKFLVQFTLAVAYYVALVPMMLVYVWHVGLPPLPRLDCCIGHIASANRRRPPIPARRVKPSLAMMHNLRVRRAHLR
jgi:ABC-type Na+ efflux pump permease subunit